MQFGLVERLKNKYSVKGDKWEAYVPIFHFLGGLAAYGETPIVGPLVRKIGLLDRPDKNFTQGRVINLNKNLNEKAEALNSVLPVQLVKNAIMESDHLYIMHRCICRDGMKCKDYPVDFGCLFIGEAANVTEKSGIAKQASKKEALAHVDRAAELGLVCQCLYIEAEKYFWGFEESKKDRFLEVCMCCPCCCLAFKTYRKIPNVFSKRVSSIGWKAEINDSCTQCGECMQRCPMQAVSIDSGGISVSEKCLGCGICVEHCPVDAIDINLDAPVKEKLTDYFWGFKPDLS